MTRKVIFEFKTSPSKVILIVSCFIFSRLNCLQSSDNRARKKIQFVREGQLINSAIFAGKVSTTFELSSSTCFQIVESLSVGSCML